MNIIPRRFKDARALKYIACLVAGLTLGGYGIAAAAGPSGSPAVEGNTVTCTTNASGVCSYTFASAVPAVPDSVVLTPSIATGAADYTLSTVNGSLTTTGGQVQAHLPSGAADPNVTITFSYVIVGSSTAPPPPTTTIAPTTTIQPTTTTQPITTTTTPSGGGVVSMDWSAFGHSTTVASATGQATKAGSLLLFMVGTDAPTNTNSLSSVSGGGLSWSLVGRQNAQGGDSEIWSAVSSSAQAAFTVTGVEANPNQAAQATLVEFSSSGGQPTVVAHNGASGTGAPSVTVTSAAWQGAVGNDFCGSTARTASSGQTILDQYDPNIPGTAQDAFWSQSSPTGTISDTAPTNQCWNMEAVSVTAPGGGGGTTTTIQPTTTTIQPTTTTTAPPPPGGALLTGASVNGRYLVDQNGAPFLMNGDSAWDVATKLSAADQQTYLADRAANGFNTILTDLVGSSGVMMGNANGSNWAGDVPFTDSNFTPNPTYWSKIDTFFNEARANGISVMAIPVDAYATGSVFSSMTNAQAQAFGAFLANRYPQSAYPGIMWMFGNDYGDDGIGCCGHGFLSQYQSLMSGLASTGGNRLTTVEEGFYESLSTDGNTIGPTVSLNAEYSYHPTYAGVIRARSAKAIPVFHIEGAYENATTGFPSTPLDLRKEYAWTMTSGATGDFYGNDSLWMFGSGWQSQLDTTSISQRKALNAALAATKWWTLQPDTNNQLVTAGRNTQGTNFNTGNTTPFTNDSSVGWYVSAAYSADGTSAVIYNPDTTRNHITVSSAVLGANPTITAVDPTTGAMTNLGWTTTPTMGANAGGDHDWLFVINAS